ncbi:hypothetical protein RCL_jg11227.t1 [Rhizophagus clarus]|uniref:Transposase Tc1-like domain-containing protein n=1 Tax=Rhizophagus clarus TaxID=94130 RepID=A0A8H3R342_9GLOM|nr:hypothetical protein RCL_jg11227.t1 [Rhizophagus clarus]
MKVSKQERQHQTILQLWGEGVCKGTEIHKITNIPLFTIYDNIKKLEMNEKIGRKEGSGHPKKITSKFFKTFGQFVRRDTSISTRTLAKKLTNTGLEVSHMTISRHLTD